MDEFRSLARILTGYVAETLAELGYPADRGTVVPSQRPELSQFQCNAAMALAKQAKRPPMEIAAEIVARLRARADVFESVEAAKPGFVNLTVTDEFLAESLSAFLNDPTFGCSVDVTPRSTVIDFGGPNVAKAMHVGHLRSTIIGDTLQRLFRFLGHHVVSDVHLGDWGTQMGMLIIEAERRWPDAPFFCDNVPSEGYPSVDLTLADLTEMYTQASQRCRVDESEMERARKATADLQAGRPGYRALWGQFVDVSHKGFDEVFRELGVEFDEWRGESTVQDRLDGVVRELLDAGVAVVDDGAVIVPLEDEDLPPMVLQKSDGAALYSTTDLATIAERVEEFQASTVLYVVDARQRTHFNQVFAVARKWGIASDVDLEHIDFGTVNGPDGKPFKTRSGDTVPLTELLATVRRQAERRLLESGLGQSLEPVERDALARKVGIAAIRYADLVHNRTSNYIFDPERFTSFDGSTGPYIQYSAVRLKSILQRVGQVGIESGPLLPPTDAERGLYLVMLALPAAIEQAYTLRMPHHLCEYVFELTREFNRAYVEIPVLHETDAARQQSRVALVEALLHVITFVASILGIELPDQM